MTVRKILRWCLDKDPKRRLRDIGDAMPLLEGATDAPAPRSSQWWKIANGALALVAAIALRFSGERRGHSASP
jgi:hypothetical protein